MILSVRGPAVAVLAAVFFAGPRLDAAGAGTTAGAFLRLGAGARAAALGNAQTAPAEDATAVYWNPAALTRLSRRSLTLTHGLWLNNELTYDHAAFGTPWGKGGALGVAAQYASAGSLTRTDADAREVGRFTPNDMAVTLAGARRFGGHAVGVSATVIRSRLDHTALAAAGGAGYVSPLLWNGALRVGASVANVGTGPRYAGRREPLPRLVRAGAALSLSPAWRWVFDVESPRGGDNAYGWGAEFHRDMGGWTGFLRGGYSSRGTDHRDARGFTLGGGAALRRMTLDYAFIPDGDLGYTHLVSLGHNF